MGLFEGAVWLKALFFVYFHTNNFGGILDDFSNVFNLQQLRGDVSDLGKIGKYWIWGLLKIEI